MENEEDKQVEATTCTQSGSLKYYLFILPATCTTQRSLVRLIRCSAHIRKSRADRRDVWNGAKKEISDKAGIKR